MGRSDAALALLAASALICCKRAAAPPPGTLTITVTDGAGGPLVAARVLLWDGNAPVRWGTNDLYDGARQVAGACEPAPGVLGTWHGLVLATGQGAITVGAAAGDCEPLPPGTYRVWAWRGFEHDRWEGEVTLARGQRVELDIALARAWRAPGTLAADLHVHAARSNDSGLRDTWRVMSQAAAGIEVIALSDHASNGDLREAIDELGLGARVASLPSNEAGNGAAHLGVYPVPVAVGAPRGGSPSAAELDAWTTAEVMAWAHALPGRPIVQVNHPRFRVYSLFDTAGWDGTSWPPPFPLDFEAVEVLAGHTAFNAPADRRTDDGVRDFYTLAQHGVRVAGVGSSDAHHLNGVLDGVARTYVYVDDPRTQPFDEAAFVAAIRARRAVATTGPWLDVEVSALGPAPGGEPGGSAGPGEELRAPAGRVRIDVSLAQASWVHATRVRVLVGGAVVKTEPITPGARTHRFSVDAAITAPTWIGVDAAGDEPLPVEMTGTYQIEKGRPGVVPFAVINPIWVSP